MSFKARVRVKGVSVSSRASAVKSRSLLGYEDRSGLDEAHPSGLGGEYPEAWDRQTDAMATWRSLQEQRQEERRERAEGLGAESQPPFTRSNGSHVQKPILIDLHPHRYSSAAVCPRCHNKQGVPSDRMRRGDAGEERRWESIERGLSL